MKRGQISIETIVIIILALLTLVIVAAAFSGGMANLWGKITGISSTIPEADKIAAKATCDEYCKQGTKDVYCNPSFAGSIAGKKCNDFTTCPTIAC